MSITRWISEAFLCPANAFTALSPVTLEIDLGNDSIPKYISRSPWLLNLPRFPYIFYVPSKSATDYRYHSKATSLSYYIRQ